MSDPMFEDEPERPARTDQTEVSLLQQLDGLLMEGLGESALKKIKGDVSEIIADIEMDIDYRLKEGLASSLSHFVQNMVNEAIDALLVGDDDKWRERLRCLPNSYTGRDRNHSVIRGSLFEAEPFILRRRIVDAHPELLKSERILDLEDQVASLVKQVAQKENTIEALRDDLNNWRRT